MANKEVAPKALLNNGFPVKKSHITKHTSINPNNNLTKNMLLITQSINNFLYIAQLVFFEIVYFVRINV